MKTHFFAPVLLATLAVTTAFASHRYASGYFAAGDNTCTGTYVAEPPCTLGNDEDCTDGLQPYYQKANPSLATSAENPCEIVRKYVE